MNKIRNALLATGLTALVGTTACTPTQAGKALINEMGRTAIYSVIDSEIRESTKDRHIKDYEGQYRVPTKSNPTLGMYRYMKMGVNGPLVKIFDEGAVNLSYNRVGVIFQNDGNKNTRCRLYNQDGIPLAISNHRPNGGRDERQSISTTFKEIPGRSGDCMDELRRQAGKHRFSKGYTIELTQPNNHGGIKIGIAHFNVYTRK